jgi:hypothetical protein
MYNESLGCFVLLMRQFALLEESPSDYVDFAERVPSIAQYSR